jgi:hypothetical protein
MKYLFILIILLIIPNACFGSSRSNIQEINYDNNHLSNYSYISSVRYSNHDFYYNFSFKSNPIVLYPERYINDLGHEFPVQFFTEGVYWKGGAWGHKNGFNNYYGNTYHLFFDQPQGYGSEHSSGNYSSVPEPSSIILLFSLSVLFFKNY